MAQGINQKERTLHTQLACAAVHILAGHGAHVHVAAQTGSIYIRFAHQRQGSLRISNHDGRKHLKYRWNVEVGGADRIIERNGRTRYYSSTENAIQFFEYIKSEFDAEEKLRCSFATIKTKQ